MVLGLTGGMGCGKTTAARMFERHGWGRIDSDAVVRDLLCHDAATIGSVRALLGAEVIAPDGSVDRARVAERVFADVGLLRRLEAIMHPRVRAERMAQVAREPSRHWVAEIPLLFEAGLEKEVDFTVCIASDPAVQAQRLASRGISPQEASRRTARQLPLAQKVERADFVITNNGSLAILQDQVTRLVKQITQPAA